MDEEKIIEQVEHEAQLKEKALRDFFRQAGSKGGSARTEAQRLARIEVARKMREAKALKRFGKLKEES